MRKKVISAGHICIDITPVFPDSIKGKASDILSPGKLINVEAADVHTGGQCLTRGLP